MATSWEIFKESFWPLVFLWASAAVGSIPLFRNVMGEPIRQPINMNGYIIIGCFIVLTVVGSVIIWSQSKSGINDRIAAAKILKDEIEAKVKSDKENTEMSHRIIAMDSTLNDINSALEKGGYKYQDGKIIPPKNIQIIKEGGSGLQSNAPNTGIQAGRDVNVIPSPTLITFSSHKLKEISNSVKNQMSKKKYQYIGLYRCPSVGSSAIQQVREMLVKEGYNVSANIGEAMMGFCNDGTATVIPFDDDELAVFIGVP